MAWFSGYCTFSDSSVVSLKSLPWSKYTHYGTIFQKNHLLKSNSFSSSNLFFIRLFLTITWKKNRGSPCLFPHNLPWRLGMVLSGGDWDEIQNKAHCVRSMHSRSSLFSYLDRAQQIPWNEFSQDLMRFWGYESLFSTILYRWRFVFQWGRVRFFCFCATMLDKETWRKDCWSIPILHMFSCLVSIHSKMWIQQ